MRHHTLTYLAMMTGLRDYVDKNGFKSIVLGLSGGIDSALTAAVAADALGPQRVHAVMLPSPYTSQLSLDEARQTAQNLSIRYDIIPISDGMAATDAMLAQLHDASIPCPIARENIQSRLRGLLLMAISNSTGALLITTGNKSEMAVGYATLYGDMCGAYSVLKDIYKTDVFTLASWRNHHQPPHALGAEGIVIPEATITRPPSAELRENQTDQDSLPPYDILDAILKALIEEHQDIASIVALGYDEATVRKVAKLLYINEYKRRQAPPGVKLTHMNFGRDRRFPLTNRFQL
jgi:NAD+ synthase